MRNENGGEGGSARGDLVRAESEGALLESEGFWDFGVGARGEEQKRDVCARKLEEVLEGVKRVEVDGRYGMSGAREVLTGYWSFVAMTNRRPTRAECEVGLPGWRDFFRSFRDLERVTWKKKGERWGEAIGLPRVGVGVGMMTEPVNEQGVVLLFGKMARELGFLVERVGTRYPDCVGMRWKDGAWRAVRIEFEYASSRFDHDPKGCDVVVCWKHDWEKCPVEVVELGKICRAAEQQSSRAPEPQIKRQSGKCCK